MTSAYRILRRLRDAWAVLRGRARVERPRYQNLYTNSYSYCRTSGHSYISTDDWR